MDKDFLIQLTSNLYRLTLFFPKKEPLRYKMREVADDILIKPNEKDLEVLDSFFEIAIRQNWVSPFELLAIKKEYDNLRDRLKTEKQEKKKKNILKNSSSVEVAPRPLLLKAITERQEKIISFLKENGRVQVWQIKKLFPEVSKRTLRRDFEQLLKQGIIERLGERNDTFYQIKKTTV